MGSQAVVLFSGGRDSLLSSCKAIERYFNIVPVFCNTGHIEGIERVQGTVKELQHRYGISRVHDLVVLKTAMTFHCYATEIMEFTTTDLIETYPYLDIGQAMCLCCKCAMYVHALAFCKANNIDWIVDGTRHSQGFFVDHPEMRNNFENLCKEWLDVNLLTPVYDLCSDEARKRQLCDRCMPTKTYEPQCYLGHQAKKLSQDNINALLDFYKGSIVDHLVEDIRTLTSVMPKIDSRWL